MAAIVLGLSMPLLVACGPLVVPESGPNSDGFPPEYELVVWTAELADPYSRSLLFETDEVVDAGTIDSIRTDDGHTVIEGWAPITGEGALWIFGFRGVTASIAAIEGQWRPDVAVAISADLMGSGFLVRVADSAYKLGDPLCVMAQNEQEWFLLVASDETACGLLSGERGS